MDNGSGWRKALYIAGGTVATAGLLWYLLHEEEEEAADSEDLLFYRVTDPRGASIGIREEPDVKSARTGRQLLPHQVFQVSEVRKAEDEQTYLRLADGRGWAFTHSSKDGRLLCEQISQEEAVQELDQSQPSSMQMMAQMQMLMETQPELREQIMASPEVQAMMMNPEMLQYAAQQHSMASEALKGQPQLQQALNTDPQGLAEALQAAQAR